MAVKGFVIQIFHFTFIPRRTGGVLIDETFAASAGSIGTFS
jgi:hypothetical protein